MTPIREHVLEGLEILYRGTSRGVFPESMMPALDDALRYLCAQVGLAAMQQIPPDDRFPDHDDLVAQLREMLAGLTGERG